MKETELKEEERFKVWNCLKCGGRLVERSTKMYVDERVHKAYNNGRQQAISDVFKIFEEVFYKRGENTLRDYLIDKIKKLKEEKR